MELISGMPVIGPDYVHDEQHGRGYEGRDYSAFPIGSIKCARKFAVVKIDPKEYADRIAEKDKKKSWITNRCDDAGLTVKNQGNSNYCWAHAPTHCMEICYAMSGGPKFVLSAFYPGAIIKGGRNQGGSGIEAVQWLAENGTCLETMHPPGDFSTRNSADTVANAALHKITEYDEFDPGDHDSIISAVLCDIPVTVGIPAWGHEVTITFLGWQNGRPIFGIDNSWSPDWGTNGRGWLSASYSRFDEAGAVRACTLSDS